MNLPGTANANMGAGRNTGKSAGAAGAARPRLASRWPARPLISVDLLALAAGLFFAVFSNGAFWRNVVATGALSGAKGVWIASCLFVAIVAFNVIMLGVLLNRWTAKPLLTVLLPLTAVAAHFMSQYGIYLDADMVRNVLHTDGKESGELISSGLVLPLLAGGVLPVAVLWWLRLEVRPLARALLRRLGVLAIAAAVLSGALLVSFQDLSALMRNHPEIRHLIAPANYLVSLGRVLSSDSAARGRAREPIGTDARVGRTPGKPRLLVLVVGETARAQNWGLNGYARQTTPQLAQIAPINFPDMTSCGTSTEVSVPCMFSPWGRAHYDKNRIKRSQSLLHVLEYAGIKTLWRDNQTGCKGVCEGLAFESFEHGNHPDFCDKERCLDEVMLSGLAAALKPGPIDQVVILHQLGNHGPSYYRRYPDRFRRFLPTCDTSELGQCSREQIANAYDNALLYTDDFLAKTIGLLAQDTTRDTAMIYLSDHGESLGENGLYLHGVPYAIAPQTQTRVPMVMWISPGFAGSRGLDLACLRRESAQPASQDNLFHSVLGLMQVGTREYVKANDLFAPCERPAG